MSAQQAADRIAQFYAGSDESQVSPEDLRTIGILFLMQADVKEAFVTKNDSLIETALHPDTYTCIGADKKTDYLLLFLTFIDIIGSDDDRSYSRKSLYDIMAALGMADKTYTAPKPVPTYVQDKTTKTSNTETSEYEDLEDNEYFGPDVNPDEKIKEGLKLPLENLYSNFIYPPVTDLKDLFRYSGGMRPGFYN
ncbi:MAG: hypothetical protein JXA44_01970 [Methanospirillaceae archaeon]|nr:hypothetical protein [Methanospirillaceae archaeon]